MQVKKLRAKNYRQHEDVEFAPEGNVIAIVGENGAGKSNLVSAMRYGMEGRVPGANKEDLLRWGEKSGFVELELAHDNDQIVLHRGLGGAKTWAKLNDEDPIRGISPTNRAVERWTGFDKSIGDIMFVGQDELTDVLFADPSIRKQRFNRMCGLGETAKIHREMLPLLQQHVPDNSDIDAKIETMRQHVAELSATQQRAETEYQNLKNRLPTTNPEDLRSQARALDETISNMREYQRSLNRVTELYKTEQTSKAALDTATQDPMANKDIQQAETMLRDVEHQLQQLAQVAQLRTRMDTAKQTLDGTPSVSVTAEQLKELEARAAELADAISEANGHCHVLQNYHGAMLHDDQHQDCCPLCKSEIDTNSLKESLAESIKAIQADIKQKGEKKAEVESELGMLTSRRYNESTAIAQAQSAYDQAKAAYDAVAGSHNTSPEAVEELRGRKSQLETVIQAIRRASSAVMQANSQWQMDKSAYENEMSRSGNLKSLLPDIDPTQIDELAQARAQEQAELRRNADEITTARARLDVLSTAMADATYSAQQAKSKLQALEDEKDTLGSAKKIMEVLTDVREWFHYERGPAQIAQRVLQGTNADVQTFLAQLDAPFTAEAVSAELTYRCMFNDGRLGPPDGWINVGDLSGGEKALMAVAFRLATYVTFAAKQGVLVLDEPTANWDNVNVRNFCELLEKLKSLAKSLGLQIFVITHHHDCLTAVDSYLELTRA